MSSTITVSDRVWTVPNALSVVRLLGVPLFLWLIIRGHDGWALAVLAGSAATDYLDGWIARRFDQVTRLGQLLDPVADRLYILSALAGLLVRGIVPWWLVALIVGRDLWGTLALRRWRSYGLRTLPVTFVGKAATFNLLYALPLLLLGHGSGAVADVVRPIAWAFTWWGVALYWLATVMYFVQAQHLVAAVRHEAAAPPSTRRHRLGPTVQQAAHEQAAHEQGEVSR